MTDPIEAFLDYVQANIPDVDVDAIDDNARRIAQSIRLGETPDVIESKSWVTFMTMRSMLIAMSQSLRVRIQQLPIHINDPDLALLISSKIQRAQNTAYCVIRFEITIFSADTFSRDAYAFIERIYDASRSRDLSGQGIILFRYMPEAYESMQSSGYQSSIYGLVYPNDQMQYRLDLVDKQLDLTIVINDPFYHACMIAAKNPENMIAMIMLNINSLIGEYIVATKLRKITIHPRSGTPVQTKLFIEAGKSLLYAEIRDYIPIERECSICRVTSENADIRLRTLRLRNAEVDDYYCPFCSSLFIDRLK